MADLQVILPNYDQAETVKNFCQDLTSKVGKNLLNPEEVSYGVLLITTGLDDGTAVSWGHSGYIAGTVGSSYVIDALPTSTSTGVCFYDSNKNFVSALSNAVVISAGNTFVMPSGCAFFRFGMLYSRRYTTQVEEGNTSTEFEDYCVTDVVKKFTDLLNNDEYINVRVQDEADDGYDGYDKVLSLGNIDLYKNNDSGKKIGAILEMADNIIAARYNRLENTIEISTTGTKGDYDNTVVFESTTVNFVGLASGAVVSRMYLLPWTRNMTTSQTGENWRLVVVTREGQIFHNYPKRGTTTDGAEQSGDMLLFEESVIWDLPNRRYPSDTNTVTDNYQYMPGLPTTDYDFYPMLNTDASYVDTYGNGGFSDTLTVDGNTLNRYYEANRNTFLYSFDPMGGFERSDKISLIGTYRSNYSNNDRSRICVFATSDGGRTWFNKYEFTSGNTSLNYGALIDTSAISASYSSGEITVKLRELEIPSASNKEPTNIYSLPTGIVVSAISKGTTTTITTATAHSFLSGAVIAFEKTESSTLDAEFDFLLNPTVTDLNGGNGIFWKVERINSTQFKLRQFIHNPYTNLPCRHIHSINKIKDGYIIGTGEVYPDGWMVYLQIKDADSYNVVEASDDFSFYRLTSTNTAIQRTLGTILLDDEDNTVLFASDQAKLSRSELLITGRTDLSGLSRSATGVYKGKLVDIDDFTKFTCILEAREPCYFFKEILGYLIFAGQRGEICISSDSGATWTKGNLHEVIQHYRGETKSEIIIDGYILSIEDN